MQVTPDSSGSERGPRPFFFTYLHHELWRRKRQALLVAVGLAVGVGLTITVAAASTGMSDATASVLHSLYGIGTDVTVTKDAPELGSGSKIKASGSKTFGFSPARRFNTRICSNLRLALGCSTPLWWRRYRDYTMWRP